MKILTRSFIVALFFGLILEEVQSAPAFPGITQIVQPNGAVVAARLKGDEWTHWVETLDGFSIAKSESDYWQYVRSYDEATPVLSGIRADHRPPVSLQQNYPEPCATLIGEPKPHLGYRVEISKVACYSYSLNSLIEKASTLREVLQILSKMISRIISKKHLTTK